MDNEETLWAPAEGNPRVDAGGAPALKARGGIAGQARPPQARPPQVRPPQVRGEDEESMARLLLAAYGGEYPCECGEFGRWLPGECEYADRCEEREPVQCWRLLAALAGKEG